MSPTVTRRVVIFTFAYLLCGFVVNVLVAWGLALWFEPRALGVTGPTFRDGELTGVDLAQTTTTGGVYYAFVCAMPPETVIDPKSADEPLVPLDEAVPHWVAPIVRRYGRIDPYLVEVEARGWPWLSFASSSVPDISSGVFPESSPTSWSMTHFGLPLHPIWPNTIWNTLLYAAAVCGVHQLLLVSRSALRQRRGLCPRCKYNLKGGEPGAGCPECGWGR